MKNRLKYVCISIKYEKQKVIKKVLKYFLFITKFIIENLFKMWYYPPVVSSDSSPTAERNKGGVNSWY